MNKEKFEKWFNQNWWQTREQIGEVPFQFIIDLTWKWIEAETKAGLLEPPVMRKIAEDNGKEDAIKEIIEQLEKYLKDGSIDFMCVNLEGIEKRLRKALNV